MVNKDTPAQTRERYRWIVDVVREHQLATWWLLEALNWNPPEIRAAKLILADMHKQDRDALLQENGILTSEQIEILK